MKDMDITDKKLMQLFRKTSSSQDKPVGLKVLQQRIGDITYYAMSTFVGYTSGFWAILKVTLAFLAKT